MEISVWVDISKMKACTENETYGLKLSMQPVGFSVSTNAKVLWKKYDLHGSRNSGRHLKRVHDKCCVVLYVLSVYQNI
jgi:hypothetical protein